MVCELILGVAQDADQGLPGLFRLSWVDQWMMTRFSRDNLGGSSQIGLGQRWSNVHDAPHGMKSINNL